MRLVTKLTRIIVLGTLIAAAGCADPASVTAPERDISAPLFDGIGTAGSGNAAGIGTAGSGNAAASSPTTSTPSGIGTAGSGNRSATDSTTTVTGIGTAGSGN